MNPFEEDELLGRAYDGRLMRRFLGYLRPHQGLVALCFGLVIAGTAVELAAPFLLGAALDGPVAHRDPGGLRVVALLFLAAISGRALLEFAGHLASNIAGQRILYDLRTQTFAHLQELPVSYYDRTPVGRLLTRVTGDVENLSELFTSGLVEFFSNLVLLAGVLAAMLWIDWKMTLLTLAATPILLAAALLFRRFARETYRETRRAIARLNAYLNESVGGVQTIQIFNRQQTCFERFEERNRDYRDRSIAAVFVYSFLWPAVELLIAVSVAALLWYAGGSILAGTMTFGTFVAFWYFTQKLFQPVRDLAEKYNILQAAMASSERIFKILDTPSDLPVPAAPQRPPRRGEIEFDRVSFSYDARTPVLQDVSFRARPGEKLAVVGITGAGKTTLVNLLLRLYDVTAGRILVDGIDVREQDPRELRRRFGLVLQDVFLFSGTVKENLRLGEDLPGERLEAAARAVQADRFIDRLPQKWETPLRERGRALSTGERQILSVARALAFDPSILVLDEATSSVDAETDALLQEALRRLLEGRTALVVAHRLSTVRNADRILVLHHGRLREEGTHEELIRREGLYRMFCRLQEQTVPA